MQKLMQPLTPASIWEQFNAALKTFICRQLHHDDDYCHDMLQELYLKIFINLSKVKEAENVRAYVFQMAHNVVTDHYRKQNRHPRPESDERIALLAEENEEKNEYRLADAYLRPMIATLPEKYREAVVLTELEGMTQQQLADKLGISLSAAKSRVQRGREKLKQVILQCCDYQFDKYGNIISCCGE